MEKQIEWVASRLTRVGPVLAMFALALAIVLAACGPGNGGGSGY